LLTLVAKGFFLFAIKHPSKEKLLYVQGIVREVRLGGDGKSTSFLIKSDKGTYSYSSYYGKVWPGMELIQPGDRVQVRVERDKLNKNELITGKKYYIWELIHNDQVVVAYDDVRDLVEATETTVTKYINGILIASAVLLIFAYIRKSSILHEK
jgi:hypothetical protein